MSDVFISYRRKPSAVLARLLQEKLKNDYDIDAYVDTTRTDATRVQFPERLMRAIAHAPTFICLLADTTLESEWVRKEIQQAYELNKYCVPVFQESYKPSSHPDEAIAYLLNFDGIHIFEEKGVLVDESIAQIAPLIIRRQTRSLPFPLWVLLAGGLAISAMMALLVLLVVGGGGSGNRKSTTPTRMRNADWTPVVQDFDGVEMALVPAGCFMMGSTDEQLDYVDYDLGGYRGWLVDEQPAHEICFEEPFWIDRYEVTQDQFDEFGGQAASDNQFVGENLPREQISWSEALDYCELRGTRLPTEAEWEYAARGPDSLVYPWGNEFEGTRMNFCDLQCNEQWADPEINDGYGTTAPVGSFGDGLSWVGVHDLSGNVWEWTSTIYDQDAYPYEYIGDDGRESRSSQSQRVLRGGAYDVTDYSAHVANRHPSDPDIKYPSVGFRCVRSD